MLKLLLFLLPLAAVHAEDPAPFWKSKEKVYERIRQGEVIVAVKKDKGLPGLPPNRLKIDGGGHVNAPRDFVFKKSLEFEELAKESGYISRCKYDAAEQKLEMEVKAFGYTAIQKLRLKIDEKSEPRKLFYEVIEGPLKGMTGVFEYSELKGPKAEVGIRGDFHYDKLSIPTFFVEFGFEVIFQRMAINLRSYVEREYKKVKAAP
jgi:hypothetical protein